MTKKHFEAIAKIIGIHYQNTEPFNNMINMLCTYFEESNPSFDTHRFWSYLSKHSPIWVGYYNENGTGTIKY